MRRSLALQVFSLLDVLCEKTDVVQVELKVSAHWPALLLKNHLFDLHRL